MTKRIIALLLALILTVGLLPTVALAEGAPKEGGQTATSGVSTVQSGTDSDNNTDNPVHVIKTFTPGENGAYGNLTLEAYVTNPLQVVTETTPLDIVLVLDQSGSMGYCINCGTEFNNEKWDNDQCNTTSASYQYTVVSRANADKSKTYYTPVDGKYYEADWCDGWHWFGVPYKAHEEGWYYNGDYGHTRVTGDLYERTKITGHKHRLDALTEALKTFVNSVEENGGDHNVAVVGFADKDRQNTELLTGVKLSTGSKSSVTARYYPQDDTVPRNGKSNPSDIEIGNALQSLKKNADGSSSAGKTNVMNAINALTAAGGTYTYSGLEIAQKILKKAKAKDTTGTRQQVVILFTDGDTNSEQDDVYGLANSMKNNGVLIYTVGLFKDADQTEGEYDGKKRQDDNNLFLNKVSNNSIEYKDQGSKPSTKTDKTYYLPAQDAASLSAVFAQISKEVSKLDLKVDRNAVLQDTLSGYFTFEADNNAKGSITVQTAAFKGIDENGQMQWGTPENATGTTVEVTGKKITVTGFDYGSSENLVTVHESSAPKYTGKKLIVTIPIKPDTTSDVTWKAGSNLYDTNVTEGDKAGLSGYGYKDKPGTLSTTLPTSPKAPVTGYTVTYSYTTDSQYTGATLPTGGTYIKGQTHKVANNLIATDYTFDGWYKTDDCSDTKIAEKSDLEITGNVTLYGKFTKSVFPVDLSAYIKKHLTLNGNISALPNPESFEITLQEYTTDGTTKTNVGNAITAKTDEIVNTSSDVPFTVGETGKLELSLSVGTHTFDVTETPGSTDKMSYGTTPQTLTVTVGANGAVTVNPTGGIIITNTYNPDNAEFNLTGKFQKHLTSNTADVPSKSFELTITGTSDNTDKSTITGTAAVGTLTASGTSYTGSANFTFKKDTEAVSALTFPAAGTYIYKVQETNSNVAGMTYDTTEYTLTIVVTGDNGALTVSSAKVTDSEGNEVANLMGTPNDTFTITNTFTAATLPLDPPKDPDGSVTGEGKVVKVMTGETREGSMTFTAKMTGDSFTGTKTATATVAANADRASFDGFGTLVFTKADTYTYEIKEEAGNDAGVSYDGHTYTLTVVVTADGDELKITSATYTDNDTVAAGTALPVTITNRYTKPAYKIEKNVITDTDVKIPGWSFEYPVDGKIVVDADTDAIRLGYVIKITGNAGASFTLEEDADGKFIATSDSEVTVITAEKELSITLSADHNDSNPILIYAVKDISRDTTTKAFPATVKNVVTEEDNTPHESGETTIEERGALTVDFGALVHKHLTVTGDKSFNGTNFTVNFTEGRYAPLVVSNSIEVYADAGVGENKLPDLTASVTYTADERDLGLKDFDGADLTINTEGNYSYIVSEQIPAGATGYDTKKYVVGIVVVPYGDGLKVEYVWYHEFVEDLATYTKNIPGGPTFYNTIDTGKDDYYPIIIPTIINKDTGMLNKTDHFAYVIGYPDGTVHPNGQITRAEVATIFFRLLRDEVRDGAFTTSNSYSDVAYGKWYNNPISTMSALGIITGYPDGTFKPDQNITRAEAMTLINRVLERKPESPADLLTNMNKWTDNMDTSKWYYLDVQEATNSHGYTRKTFNYELWRQMLPDPDWSRYER